MAEMPKLEFEVYPAPEEEKLPSLATRQDAVAEEAHEIDQLSPEEQDTVRSFLPKIDIMNSQAMLQYGMPAQNKIAGFSDNVLRTMRTKDLGEVGKALTDLVVEIKNYDADTSEASGIMSWFRGSKQKVEKIAIRYNKVETNLEGIVAGLEQHRKTLLKDIATYDSLYENNLTYLRELTLYYIAGKEKLREIEDTQLPEYRKKAESGDALEAQKLNDMMAAIRRFEKKLHDLQLSRTVSLQMGPQIRLLQNNDAELVDKIQSSIVNAIPLWKNQMVIALGLTNSKLALEAQKSVTNMTNELLKKNSEMLKLGTIEVAKESERGIVDMETLRRVNADLIETINDVYRIQEEGRVKRQEAEQEIQHIEQELRAALMQNAPAQPPAKRK